DFCPHCGNTIGGTDQVVGQMLVCKYCGKDIGIVPAKPEKVMADRAAEIIQGGTAARCPVCGQLVEVKISGGVRSLVPHRSQGDARKMCPGGGKPVAPSLTTAP